MLPAGPACSGVVVGAVRPVLMKFLTKINPTASWPGLTRPSSPIDHVPTARALLRGWPGRARPSRSRITGQKPGHASACRTAWHAGFVKLSYSFLKLCEKIDPSKPARTRGRGFRKIQHRGNYPVNLFEPTPSTRSAAPVLLSRTRMRHPPDRLPETRPSPPNNPEYAPTPACRRASAGGACRATRSPG